MARPSTAFQQLALLCLACSPALLPAAASAQMRRALPAHVAAPAAEPAVAPAPAGQPIRFAMTLPLRNEAALQALVKRSATPQAPAIAIS